MTTVLDLVKATAPQLKQIPSPAMSAIEAVNAAMDILFKHLVTLGSDLVKADYELEFAISDASKALPDDCRGLAGKPQVTTMAKPLEPLVVENRAAYYGQSGVPECYDLRGFNLLLYPVPAEACTVIGEYWQTPTKATAMTSIIPYNGMFDEVFKEALVRGAAVGRVFATDQTFAVFVMETVDSILPKRKSGRRRTSAFWF